MVRNFFVNLGLVGLLGMLTIPILLGGVELWEHRDYVLGVLSNMVDAIPEHWVFLLWLLCAVIWVVVGVTTHYETTEDREREQSYRGSLRD